MTLRTLRNANAPTLKDLARIAGVSPITRLARAAPA